MRKRSHLARREGRPILLSIGYSACHWCHVMAHESFEDAEVAAVMNRLFVNIKVDREERPDLDQIYQTAHQMLTSRAGGWPLTMFLAPDGAPFFGGTYFPSAALRPARLRRSVPAVAEAWRDKRADIAQQNAELLKALAAARRRRARSPRRTVGRPAQARRRARGAGLRSAVRRLRRRAEVPASGRPGTAAAPPRRDGRIPLRRDGADHPARMAEGGLYDQLGGGFCRYSVDERWEIPHFEKMLYDNGPLLRLYADAWRVSGDACSCASPRKPPAGSCAKCSRRKAATTPRSTPTPSTRKASSTSGRAKKSVATPRRRNTRWSRRTTAWTAGQLRGRALASARRAAAGRKSPPRWQAAGGVRAPARLGARKAVRGARAAHPPGRDDKILTSWNAS
jgi:uncharacterized protein YyaL (SSP411 family)